jgi:uncharacterized protein (DUF736 family)
MAQIGTFTRNEDGSFAGVIKTLNLSVKARLVVAEKDSEKSPDLRALVGNIEIGAAWKKVAKETGREYHSSSSTIRASRSDLREPRGERRRLRSHLVALKRPTSGAALQSGAAIALKDTSEVSSSK